METHTDNKMVIWKYTNNVRNKDGTICGALTGHLNKALVVLT